MSTLYLREYSAVGVAANGETVPIPLDGGGTRDQTVTFSTTARSAAFNKSTKYIGFICKTAFHYKIATGNPDATTSNMYHPANVPIFVGLQEADMKIAAVDAT